MCDGFRLIQPGVLPPLDGNFRPAALANRAFLEEVEAAIGRLETHVFPEGHPRFQANLEYAERLLKFLLWQRGGWRVHVGGPRAIGDYLQTCFAPDGARSFDWHFMGEDVYEQPFTVIPCRPEDTPAEKESGAPLGRHLDGCRIGFDLGASDRKVSAVVDGEAVFSQEVVWDPRNQSDPG
jgi:hypothetical protein